MPGTSAGMRKAWETRRAKYGPTGRASKERARPVKRVPVSDSSYIPPEKRRYSTRRGPVAESPAAMRRELTTLVKTKRGIDDLLAGFAGRQLSPKYRELVRTLRAESRSIDQQMRVLAARIDTLEHPRPKAPRRRKKSG